MTELAHATEVRLGVGFMIQPHDMLHIAVNAMVSLRTVQRCYSGCRQLVTTRKRIALAARRLGLPEPGPGAHVDPVFVVKSEPGLTLAEVAARCGVAANRINSRILSARRSGLVHLREVKRPGEKLGTPVLFPGAA